MFESAEIRRTLDGALPAMKVMILLAINGGLGQTDLANLPKSAVDLDGSWLNYPRPKTAVERRIPLWPETVQSLKEAIAERPAAKNAEDNDMVFLTRNGLRFVRNSDGEKQTWIDSLGRAFKKLIESLGINDHRNFYALRHSFETIAGESKDPIAMGSLMGHVDSSMASLYRERISDERLRAVTDTVHEWLFGS